MREDWRTQGAEKIIRQMVTCPSCGALVSEAEGIGIHSRWHQQLDTYVQGIDSRFQVFESYIINPTDGLEKRTTDAIEQIKQYIIAPTTGLEARTQASLDQITQYIIAPTTGLEPRTGAAITTLRNDATNAINALNVRVTALEPKR
jgi:hypothetical protein